MPASSSALRPRKTPVQDRSRRTRARILRGAAQVFAEYGYAGGTTDRIAAAAALSIGSVYQYFPNKDAILLVLARDHLEQSAVAVRTHLAQSRTMRVWLTELTTAVVQLHAANPRLHRVLFEEAPRPPQLLAQFQRIEQEAVDQVAALLIADPEVQENHPEQQARFVVGAVESLTHRFMGHEPQIDESTLIDHIVKMIDGYLR